MAKFENLVEISQYLGLLLKSSLCAFQLDEDLTVWTFNSSVNPKGIYLIRTDDNRYFIGRLEEW